MEKFLQLDEFHAHVLFTTRQGIFDWPRLFERLHIVLGCFYFKTPQGICHLSTLSAVNNENKTQKPFLCSGLLPASKWKQETKRLARPRTPPLGLRFISESLNSNTFHLATLRPIATTVIYTLFLKRIFVSFPCMYY